uniref:Glycosyltransferase 2-like domain-containing protein n=1 Tax=Plectus sambesii TaxID=2011161 RepID=A0A914V8S3_9BILA
MKWTIGSEPNEAEPGGVGYAKNRAVQQSSGQFLCFLDADDVMLEDRVQLQYEAALACENRLCLIGSRFIREPKDSTIRYSRWANDLSSRQLYDQAYTSHGPTVIAPTWFMSRALYDAVGGFQEEPRRGYPEDLDFFYRGLAVGAELKKVECELTIYRYHRTSASFGVSEETIWQLRVCQFQTNVLNKWPHFTIWNAGKQGKKFYKSLTKDNQEKVVAFCDVDSKKLAQKVYEQYDAESRTITARVPIISYQMARPPAVICVKLDMTDGALEGYLRDLCWTEGVHYFHLS